MVNEYLTAEEAAGRLKVHLMTIYKWIKSGRIQARRLPGGGLRIDAQELEKLLGQNKRNADGKRGK